METIRISVVFLFQQGSHTFVPIWIKVTQKQCYALQFKDSNKTTFQ